VIQAYRFGHIEINGKAYRNDVKLIGAKVIPEWWRGQGHLVEMKDVQDLLKADAEICIFGTGAYGSMRVSESVRSAFQDRGIKVVMKQTEPACHTYNQLIETGKKVVAGLHLTC
jgi:hypothetical protein